MRIYKEKKNLAFRTQPEPLLAADVGKKFKTKKPKKKLAPAELDLSFMIPVVGEAKARAIVPKSRKRGSGKEVRLRVENFNVGTHVFPPSMRAKGFKTLGNKSRRFKTALQTQSYLPDHLALKAAPGRLPARLAAPARIETSVGEKFGNQATTIFGADNRRVFSDTSYPWSTCGRVDTPLGSSSGVMVGPRHLLTVSHAIQWNSDGTAGWVRFRPSFFNGSAPFGEAWGVRTYFKFKVVGPTVDLVEGMFDYVCVVLNNRIGNLTGWMGSRGYTDAWDGGAYWAHVGYPGDLTGGNRPTFQNSIPLDGVWWQADSHEAMAHRGDVWPGQSGGPLFGWWSGDVGPRAVAVQSSQNSTQNNASGGQDMVDLILRAQSDFP